MVFDHLVLLKCCGHRNLHSDYFIFGFLGVGLCFILCGDLFQLCFRHFDKLSRKKEGCYLTIRLVVSFLQNSAESDHAALSYVSSPSFPPISVATTSSLLAHSKFTSRTRTSCFPSLSYFLLSHGAAKTYRKMESAGTCT